MRIRLLPYLALLALALPIQPVRGGPIFSGKARAEGDALYKAAFAAYDTGDFPRAQELLNQAEKLKPDQADGWNLRGAVFLKQKLFGQAEAAFKRASALDPNLWAAQFNYAEAAFRGKNYPASRARFDHLVDQTNRFKEKNQWELAQYKAVLCSLMLNDDAGAQKRLAKLPAVGAVTPALSYAQAAVAFHRRDETTAQKALSVARTTYSPNLNNLFSDALETLGWQAASVPPGVALATATPPMPPSVSPSGPVRPAYVIDPRLEAAAAEPLPVAEPVPSASATSRKMIPVINASPSDALLEPSGAVKAVATPAPVAESALERGALLD